MKTTLSFFIILNIYISCNNKGIETGIAKMKTASSDSINFRRGFSKVNGIDMYYEIYGKGNPFVLIHGGGSTIETSFGRIISLLSKKRQLICVELQAHGRSGDRDTALSFQQDADDVAMLLKNLNIGSADFLGFSNGGNTALQIAIRHPQLCRKIVSGSVLLKRSGTLPQFWEFMKNGTFEQMPQQYKDAFMKVNPDSTKLYNMFRKCAERMINFNDFTDEQIKSISAPVLLINGDKDVATSEHIVAMSKLITDCNLAIIPGGHGAYIGEITTYDSNNPDTCFVINIIENFLDK